MSNNPKKRILAAAITAALLVGITAPASTVFAAAPSIHQAHSLVHRKDPSDDGSLVKGGQELLAAQTPTLSAKQGDPLPVLGASSYSDSWTDGDNYDTAWYDGHSSEDSFTISTPEELAGLAYLVNEGNTFEGKTITLDGDLDLSGHNWTPIGIKASRPFQGTFDGGDHTIDQMIVKLEDSSDVYAGLFGVIKEKGVVQNISIGAQSSISATATDAHAYAGGVAGGNYGTITNCTNSGEVSSSNTYAGGLAGINYNKGTITNGTNSGEVSSPLGAGGVAGTNSGTITNCASSGTVSSSGYAGGVAGNNYGTITNGTNSGIVSADDTAGGLAGYNYFGTITNGTNSGIVSADDTAGGLAGTNSGTITNCYWPEGAPAAVGENKRTVTDCSAFAGPDGRLLDKNDMGETVVDALNAWVNGKGGSYWNWTDEPQEESLTMYYPLTVVGGDGSGMYYKGESVTIKADSPPSGKRFRGWNIEPTMTLNNASSRTLTFSMPIGMVTATANFSTIASTHKPDKETPITPTPDTLPGSPDRPGSVDTTKASVPAGGTYEALVYGVTDPNQIKVEVSDPDVAGFTISSDPRGSKIQIFGKKEGKVTIKILANGILTEMEVEVQPLGGSLLIDTKSVTIPAGQQYQIGLTLFDENDQPLTPEQVKALLNPAPYAEPLNPNLLTIRDSRTGSVVDMQVLDNGHLLLTAKNPPANPVAYLQIFYKGQSYSIKVTAIPANAVRAGESNSQRLYWAKTL